MKTKHPPLFQGAVAEASLHLLQRVLRCRRQDKAGSACAPSNTGRKYIVKCNITKVLLECSKGILEGASMI